MWRFPKGNLIRYGTASHKISENQRIKLQMGKTNHPFSTRQKLERLPQGMIVEDLSHLYEVFRQVKMWEDKRL